MKRTHNTFIPDSRTWPSSTRYMFFIANIFMAAYIMQEAPQMWAQFAHNLIEDYDPTSWSDQLARPLHLLVAHGGQFLYDNIMYIHGIFVGFFMLTGFWLLEKWGILTRTAVMDATPFKASVKE